MPRRFTAGGHSRLELTGAVLRRAKLLHNHSLAVPFNNRTNFRKWFPSGQLERISINIIRTPKCESTKNAKFFGVM
jgi:hypothetical protein